MNGGHQLDAAVMWYDAESSRWMDAKMSSWSSNWRVCYAVVTPLRKAASYEPRIAILGIWGDTYS